MKIYVTEEHDIYEHVSWKHILTEVSDDGGGCGGKVGVFKIERAYTHTYIFIFIYVNIGIGTLRKL